ncbi:TlpA family protein disulfide reductase [Brevibacillus composti]|uniref:TlpA family protein disulfide reductase n=1 Tax=Brevibacillus composti TaxID=2796470 RepID=A0A7T5JQK7_9BACL|nr:TlpA disulfide reductase family protein [Brevibacillus composti]QQE76424.1 TlpA family protein disulfide reductase [Brevibacillus composti]QUO43502.1 TlpA family protein disulfide reductase [Brevibacillus composti]
MNIRFLFVFAIILTATYLVVGTGKQDGNTEGIAKPDVRYQAPAFLGTSLDGQEIALSQLQGKPVFLNFWASWCPPCKAEMPDLTALHERYGDAVSFLGIHTTYNDSEEAARDFVSFYQVKYPVLVDPQGTISKEYQIIAMPTSFIIDPRGQILFKKIGPLTIEEFERVVRPMLQKESF